MWLSEMIAWQNHKDLYCSKAELEELDHEICEDIPENTMNHYGEIGTGEDVSEWHSFFIRNLELIARIAELLPDQIFTLVVSYFFPPFVCLSGDPLKIPCPL